MADIVITEFMDESAVSNLAADFDILYDPELVDNRSALEAAIAQCRGLIVRNRTQVDAGLIACAPQLKVIGRLGVGLDNIDLAAAAARAIPVCPATGANAASVAEYVIAAVLQLLRPLSPATTLMMAGQFPRPDFSGGQEIGGRCLGLVGGGMIGREVALRARALGMEVLVADPMLTQDDIGPGWKVVALEDCLAAADAVSLHIPLTDETRGMVDAARLRQMKPGAVLINTARGGIIDHAALAGMLRDGHIRGAALDVFDAEPTSAADLAVFEGIDNILLTPHVAGLTADSNLRVGEITARQVRNVLEKN